MMTRGFVTMATGNEEYYQMALNLLRSYHFFTKNPYPFAIIADQENSYTKEFDYVVLLRDSQRNYMDKIDLLKMCPYEENIFIDADCLAYSDLNRYWDAFKNADDFSVFGKALPLDSKEGWFQKSGGGEYKDKLHFVTHLHGVIYFIRPGDTCNKMYDLCHRIIQNYDEFTIPFFPNPADESVFALAMAIMNLKPTKRKPEYYIFLPVADYIDADISRGFLKYKTSKDPETDKGMLIHFAHLNTKKALYKSEVLKLEYLVNGKNIDRIHIKQCYSKWLCEDKKYERKRRIGFAIEKMKSNLYKVYSQIFHNVKIK